MTKHVIYDYLKSEPYNRFFVNAMMLTRNEFPFGYGASEIISIRDRELKKYDAQCSPPVLYFFTEDGYLEFIMEWS